MVNSVTADFGAATYSAAEGASVTVTLSAAPRRTVVIPMTTTDADGSFRRGDPWPGFGCSASDGCGAANC